MPTVTSYTKDEIDILLGDAVAENLTGPAPAASGGDDTAVLQAWLNGLGANKTGTLRPVRYSIFGTLTIPAGVTLLGYGATVKGTSGSADLIALSSGSRLYGLEVDGNAATRTGGNGVTIAGATRTVVQDCYLHDIDGKGVSVAAGSADYTIARNRIVNCGGQGISLDGTSRGTVTGNRIDTAQHGIQWWGGDSATSNTIGISRIVIADNQITAVAGGIWGSLGRFITVTGNEIAACTDVGIDFEGCSDCTATGNVISEATNGGLAVFYGSQRVAFIGNTVNNTTSTGPGFQAYTSETSTQIAVTGNVFSTSGTAVTTDAGALADSVVNENVITVTGTSSALRFLTCNNMTVNGNTVRTHGPTGISFEGGSDSRIEQNQIITDNDTTAAGANSGGIFIYWASASAPAKHNRVRNNILRGFQQSVFDNCWGDVTSYTLIENNLAPVITRKTGTGYTGVISNNRNDSSHAVVTATAV